MIRLLLPFYDLLYRFVHLKGPLYPRSNAPDRTLAVQHPKAPRCAARHIVGALRRKKP